jgi:hypothetical protein
VNTNLDTALAYIWTSAQKEENFDRTPPDYTFSFARVNRSPLAGIISKDMAQSYIQAPPRSAASHPYACGLQHVDRYFPEPEDVEFIFDDRHGHIVRVLGEGCYVIRGPLVSRDLADIRMQHAVEAQRLRDQEDAIAAEWKANHGK